MNALFISLLVLLLLALLFIAAPLINKNYRNTLSWTAVSFSAGLLIMGSLSLYLWLGSSADYLSWRQYNEVHYDKLHKLQAELSNPEIVNHIKNHLELHPEDTKGWYYLGEVYLFKHQYSAAKHAFAKVLKQDPNNAKVIMLHAKAEYFANNGSITAATRQQLETIKGNTT